MKAKKKKLEELVEDQFFHKDMFDEDEELEEDSLVKCE